MPTVELKHRRMVLRVRPGTTKRKRQAIVNEWYRNRLKKAVASLIGKWQLPIGVNVDRFFVQRMKTKWGSCNASSKMIRLNTELAKKSPQCLEYIVVHEMVQLLVRRHDDRFHALPGRGTEHLQSLDVGKMRRPGGVRQRGERGFIGLPDSGRSE